jgi:hypothetical protein
VDTNYLIHIADITDPDLNSNSTFTTVLHSIDDILNTPLSAYTIRRLSVKVETTAPSPYFYIEVEAGFNGNLGLSTATASSEFPFEYTSSQIQQTIIDALGIAYRSALNASLR